MAVKEKFKNIGEAQEFLNFITSSLDRDIAGKYSLHSFKDGYRFYRLDAVTTDTCMKLSKGIKNFDTLEIKPIVEALMRDVCEYYENRGQEKYKRDLQRFLGIRE